MRHPRASDAYVFLALVIFVLLWISVYITSQPLLSTDGRPWYQISLPSMALEDRQPTQVCSIILVNDPGAEDATLSEIERLYEIRRADGGLVDVGLFSEGKIKHIATRAANHRMAAKTLVDRLTTMPSRASWPSFVEAALDWTAHHINSSRDCHRWDVILSSPPPRGALPPNLIERFCPTRTHFFVLEQSPVAVGGSARLGPPSRIAASGNVKWRTCQELDRHYQKIRVHRVYLDVSASLGTSSKDLFLRMEWMRHTLDDDLLPSFLATVPYEASKDRLEVYVFASTVEPIAELRLDDVVTVPSLPEYVLSKLDVRKTYLSGVFDDLHHSGEPWLSAWIFSDGVDDPPRGNPRLSRWLDGQREHGLCFEGEQRGWLYLQRPDGIELGNGSVDGETSRGSEDSDLSLFRDAAACLGLELVEVPRLSSAAMDRCQRVGSPRIPS